MKWTSTLIVSPLLWSSATHAAELCEPTPSGAFRSQIHRVQQAVQDLDSDRFSETLNRTDELLPCLNEVISSTLAAEIHLWHGYRSFLARDLRAAEASFGAAAHTRAPASFDPAIVPAQHDAWTLYEQAAQRPDERTDLPELPDGRWVLDGVPARTRPTQHAAIVQRVTGSGEVLITAYLQPSDPLPALPALSHEIDDPPSARLKTARAFTWTGTVAAAVASGVLYGLAMSAEAGFQQDHSEWTKDDLARQRDRTNRLAIASAATGGAAAVGLGLVVVLP